jgi:hypothetical protein
MPKKKDIIRVGDRVKILRPLFIYRWGYDNNFSDVYDEVMKKYQPQIWEFLSSINGLEGRKTGLVRLSEFPKRYISRMASAIAYNIVGSRISDGAVRKLFYITDEDKGPLHWLNYDFPAGSIKEVREIKIVKTGRYFSPCSSQSYEGEYDWEPGGLYEEKTHKLLRVGYTDNWIEAINVEKIHEN